jgi:hypothetical protein
MDYFYFISIPLNQALVHSRRDTAIGMDPISPKQDGVRALAVDKKNEVGTVLPPIVKSTLRTPCASEVCPLKSLNVMLVLIRSPTECPNRRSIAYDIMLTAAPVSTSILLIG